MEKHIDNIKTAGEVIKKVGDVHNKFQNDMGKGIANIFTGDGIKAIVDLVTPPTIELSEEDLKFGGFDDLEKAE